MPHASCEAEKRCLGFLRCEGEPRGIARREKRRTGRVMRFKTVSRDYLLLMVAEPGATRKKTVYSGMYSIKPQVRRQTRITLNVPA